ncbi:MAG: helix-hairpin-helix domain-containing protein [Minisyncoccota bacterium]
MLMRTFGSLALIALLPVFAHAATLININTADATLFDTLPGIGPTKAAAIVDYRNQNGPFTTIEDIQNVSGIGPVTFANIESLITVDNTNASDTASTASSTPEASSSSGGAATYVPPPSALTVEVSGNQNAVLEVPLHLSGIVKTKSGATDSAARLMWSFGDGSAGEGTSVEKTYHYAGTYLVTVTAADGATSARDELTITVKPAVVRIATVSGDGITIANDALDRLDLSGWRLSAGTGFFRIPNGTILLPNTSVLFPSVVTNLPVALDASLVYPDGVVATRYTPPPATAPAEAAVAVQPSASSSSSSLVQTVEPIISAKSNIQVHAKEAQAPAAATELAAAGAALVSAQADTVAKPRASGIFHSPWTLGFLGVVALAASAFIVL